MTDTSPSTGSGQAPSTGSGQRVAADRLKSFIERIERLKEEKAGLAEDITSVFAEAKATGFDPKIMRQVIKLRAMEQNERDEQDHLLELYRKALGLWDDTPLGKTVTVKAAE